MAGKENDVIHAMFNRASFVKIKQCLEIGKILFSFVNMNSADKHIDCYMDAEEFGALLMSDVKNMSLLKRIANEKTRATQAGEKYPKEVWTSPIGGTSKGMNGGPVSRSFSIAPGSSAEVVITARVYPATINDKGAFIATKGSQPLETVRVSCTLNDLRLLQYKWSWLEKEYMSAKYCMEAMKSDWAPDVKQGNEQTSTSYQSSQPAPSNQPAPVKPQPQPQPQPQAALIQPTPEIQTIDCVTQENIKSHNNGAMTSMDILCGASKARLWIKKETGVTLEPYKRYKLEVKRKENDYLLVKLA